jgi:hypothetical protein
MKSSFDVKDRKEADQIRRALDEPDVRAFVVVMGALLALPTDRARVRCLQWVADRIDEERTAVVVDAGEPRLHLAEETGQ